MNDVGVSVLTAVHRPEPSMIRDAYESLLVQEGVEWQWVVQVDGDEGASAIEREIREDPRVDVSGVGERRGAAAARNLGLLRCRYELVQNLDGDDALLPGALSSSAIGLLSHPGCCAVRGRLWDWTSGSPRDPEATPHPDPPFPVGPLAPRTSPDSWLATGYDHTATCGVMYKRVYLDAAGGWAAMRGSEDISMLLWMLDRWPLLVADHDVLLHRRHPAQSTREATLVEGDTDHRIMVARRVLAERALSGDSTPWRFRHGGEWTTLERPELR